MDGLSPESTMSEEHFNHVAKSINEELQKLQRTCDTKLLFAALLGYGSCLGELLVASGKMTPEEITGMYVQACYDSTTVRKRNKPVETKVIDEDGGEPHTKH